MDERFAEIAATLARHPHTLGQLQELMRDAERKKAIGERIKALRERRGLTQPQLMDAMGLDRSKFRSLQNWEAGGGTSHENYERLSEALGCSYDYLVTGAEAMPPAEDVLSRLDEIDAHLERLAARVGKLVAEVSALQAPQHQRSRSKRPAGARERAAR